MQKAVPDTRLLIVGASNPPEPRERFIQAINQILAELGLPAPFG